MYVHVKVCTYTHIKFHFDTLVTMDDLLLFQIMMYCGGESEALIRINFMIGAFHESP